MCRVIGRRSNRAVISAAGVTISVDDMPVPSLTRLPAFYLRSCFAAELRRLAGMPANR